MKLSRIALLLSLVAVVLASTVATIAHAGDALIATKQVQWIEPGASTATDTTFVQDENDSVRTVAIDTSDWDWDSIAHAQLTGGSSVVRIWFVATGGASVASDTLNYAVEPYVGSVYGYNSALPAAASVWNSAYVWGGTLQAGHGNLVFAGSLLADPDSYSLSNVWLTPQFRIVLRGDQSGSSPKVSGVKCYVTYPQRAASK